MADIKAVTVTLYTEDDDKDKEETVNTKIIYEGGEILANNDRGNNQRWPDNSREMFNLSLSRSVAEADSGNMKIVVSKSPYGSPSGCGWHMTVSASGTLSNGKTKNLLPRTSPVQIGDGEPISREWSFE